MTLAVTAAAMLLLPATAADATFAKQCPAGGVKVTKAASPATVLVTDTRTQTPLSVRVTITGTTFTITPTDSAVTLETASWCLKAKNAARVETGTGTSGASTIKNQNGVTKPIASVVVYSVTSTATDPVNTCFDSSQTYSDLLYAGPINTHLNATTHNSGDGTCSGAVAQTRTIVQASDQAGALALCGSLTGSATIVGTMQFFGYDAAPADYWICGAAA